MNRAGRPVTPEAERFWKNVRRGGPDECWLWTAGRTRQGYGKFTVRVGVNKERTLGAHRVAWRLTHGRDPVGLLCHKCDNPPCCSPAHLYEGTVQTNNSDRHLRGRDPRGEVHGRARLTDDLVRQIRAAYQPQSRSAGPAALARRFALPVGTVRNIVYRLTWSHVA